MSKYTNDEKIVILRKALWNITDRVEKVIGLERLFGEGMTETDLVTEAIHLAEADYEKEKLSDLCDAQQRR